MSREPQTSTQDRRSNDRQRMVAQVRMTVESTEVEGVTDNISQVGLLFFSQDTVRVRLEVETDGVVKHFNGKLVRAQRMKETSTGFAVEFDPE